MMRGVEPGREERRGTSRDEAEGDAREQQRRERGTRTAKARAEQS